MIFLITLHSPSTHKQANAQKGKHLMPDALKIATTDEDSAHGLDEIVHGVDVGG